MPAVVQAPQPPGSQTLPKCHLSVWGKPFSLHPFQIPIEGHFNLTSHFLEEVKGQKTWSNSQSYNVRRADNSRKKIQCRCFHGGRSGAQALYTVGSCHLCGGVRHQRIKIKSLCAVDTSFPKVGDYLPGIMPWNMRRALPLEGPGEWVGGQPPCPCPLRLGLVPWPSSCYAETLRVLRRTGTPILSTVLGGLRLVLHLPLPYRSPGECSGPGAAHAGRAGTPPRESLVEPETLLFHILSEPRYGDSRDPLVIVAELTAKSSHGQR